MKKQFYSLALTAIAFFAITTVSYAQIPINASKASSCVQNKSFALKSHLPEVQTNTLENTNLPTPKKEHKSTWIGGGFDLYYTDAVAGDQFFIAGSEFLGSTVGDQITKVKFYHVLGTVNFPSGPVTFTNTSYTIKIYENPVLGGPHSQMGIYDTNIGTPVYTQTVVLGT